jgi:hypothetical protein
MPDVIAAQFAVRDCCPSNLGGGVESVLGNDRYQRAGLLLCGDDVVNLGESDLRRLLDDHVFASFQRLDRHLGTAAGRCADDDDVDIGCGHGIGQ